MRAAIRSGLAASFALFVACGQPSPRPVVANGASSASSIPTPSPAPTLSSMVAPSASASIDPTPPPPPPKVYEVHLEVEPTKDAPGFTLWLRATGLADRLEVMRFASSKRCDADVDAWAELRTLVVGCGGERAQAANFHFEKLTLFDRDGKPHVVEVPATSTVQLDTDVAGQPKNECASDAAGPTIDVFVDMIGKLDDDSRNLRVRAPAIDFEARYPYTLATKCSGVPMQIAHGLLERCAFQDTFLETRMLARDGVLLVRDTMIGYAGRKSFPLGGAVLPCGARVKFHPLKLRDPKFVPFYGVCSDACDDARELCTRPCWEKLTDADGVLTEKGTACVAKCDAGFTLCQGKCKPGT